ncbi:unnamed protein product [Kuraishia capsulata CBS 1993]|uniref:t-SNARE coiled-coil homology domain-containing protein n=1 Tax=Kuraishia capsulata CBS 1993 TaxID=1382522 RepID=W6MFI7_9ASCO|nr:uncharacterized protein KUCA_T00000063001 [Kuraishia capsulata CBS 1993]CDK24103.1 unnamed protein product [Kuraishia capsulata CBS 1993]
MSRFSQLESENTDRFDALASKLSSLKKITQDINTQAAQDSSIVNDLNNGMSTLVASVKTTSTKLARVMNQNTSLTRMVILGLLAIFILWTLLKLW